MTIKIVEIGKYMRSTMFNINCYIENEIIKYGIKHGQFDYFLLIYENYSITQNEIAKLRNVGKASVTKALKILEEKKLIKRVVDKKDKRVVHCYISELGKSIINNLINVNTQLDGVLLKHFSDEDKEKYLNLLKKLHANSHKLLPRK